MSFCLVLSVIHALAAYSAVALKADKTSDIFVSITCPPIMISSIKAFTFQINNLNIVMQTTNISSIIIRIIPLKERNNQ